MVSSGVTIKDTGWNDLKKALVKAGKSELVVGIPGAIDLAKPTPAGLGILHEFGTPTIPERSFLRSTFDMNERKYTALLTKYLQGVVDTRNSNLTALFVVGETVRADVIGRIQSRDIPPPLKAATIAAKKSETPLVDTGALVGSIVSKVRRSRPS